MAERRMFAKTVIDSDAFLEMPTSTQALYFHLAMRADDDGFINNPKRIQRLVNCTDDDLKLLIVKRFIIPFESGIVVIKHWKIYNYIRNDRYKPTIYAEEKALLEEKENKAYTERKDDGIPDGYQMDTQYRLGKDSTELELEEEKNMSDKPTKPIRHKYGMYTNVLLTDEDMEKLKAEFPLDYPERIERLSEYIESKGVKYKNHLATIRVWARKEKERGQTKPQEKKSSGNVFLDILNGGEFDD